MMTIELLRLLTEAAKKKPDILLTIKKDEGIYLRQMMVAFLEHLSDEEEYIPYKNVCRKIIAQIDAEG